MSSQDVRKEAVLPRSPKQLIHMVPIFGAALAVACGIPLFAGFFERRLLVLFVIRSGFVIGVGGGLLILGISRTLGEFRALAFLTNVFVLATTLLVLLLFSEVVVRFVFRDLTTTGDGRSYFAKVWTSKIRLNRWKFREREFELAKPSHSYRIAVIGDSFTYGQGIPEEDRFSNLLEKDLNHHGAHDEVLNFGVPGAETIDEIDSLKNVVLQVEPDFILLQWYLNDFEGHNKEGRPKLASLPLSQALCDILYPRSALFYLINRQWISWQEKRNPTANEAYLFRRFGNPDSSDSREARETLRNFISICKQRDKPLGIVLFPEPDLGERYPYAYIHDRVLEVCAQEEITCIDLRQTYAHYAKESLAVNKFDRHPSSLANRIASQALMDVFGPVWLSRSPQ